MMLLVAIATGASASEGDEMFYYSYDDATQTATVTYRTKDGSAWAVVTAATSSSPPRLLTATM